jgi:hypothetical protein
MNASSTLDIEDPTSFPGLKGYVGSDKDFPKNQLTFHVARRQSEQQDHANHPRKRGVGTHSEAASISSDLTWAGVASKTMDIVDKFTLGTKERGTVEGDKDFSKIQSTPPMTLGQWETQDNVDPAKEEGVAITITEVPVQVTRTYAAAAAAAESFDVAKSIDDANIPAAKTENPDHHHVHQQPMVDKMPNEPSDKEENQAWQTAFERSFASLFSLSAIKIPAEHLEGEAESLASSVSHAQTAAYEASPMKADRQEERSASVALQTMPSNTALTYAKALEKAIDNEIHDPTTRPVSPSSANVDSSTGNRLRKRTDTKPPSRAAANGRFYFGPENRPFLSDDHGG